MNFNKIKEYIESIPGKIKGKFNKKNFKEESLSNDINKIESELSKIYFDVMNSEEISIYKKELINQKLGLLNIKLENININLIRGYEFIPDMLEKEKKRERIILIIETILLIFLPPLGVIFLLCYTFYSIIHLIKLLELSKSLESNKNKEMENQLRNMMNTLHNCGLFLTKKHNIWLENQDKRTNDNLIKSLEVKVANDLLQEYLNSGYYREVPANIENYLIKMLQDDLQTEETELETLMEIAKNKISYENLDEELDLGVNLSRNIKK